MSAEAVKCLRPCVSTSTPASVVAARQAVFQVRRPRWRCVGSSSESCGAGRCRAGYLSRGPPPAPGAVERRTRSRRGFTTCSPRASLSHVPRVSRYRGARRRHHGCGAVRPRNFSSRPRPDVDAASTACSAWRTWSCSSLRVLDSDTELADIAHVAFVVDAEVDNPVSRAFRVEC